MYTPLSILQIGGQANPMTPDTTKTVCICTPSETTTGMTTHVLAKRHSFAKSSKWVYSLSEEMSFLNIGVHTLKFKWQFFLMMIVTGNCAKSGPVLQYITYTKKTSVVCAVKRLGLFFNLYCTCEF